MSEIKIINVGRGSECNLQLPNNLSISRKHLRVSYTENSEEFLIEDLGSTQGTYVQTPKGWARIKKSRVNKYARLRLGRDKQAVETTPAALQHAFEEQNRGRIAQPSPSGISRNPDTGELIHG